MYLNNSILLQVLNHYLIRFDHQNDIILNGKIKLLKLMTYLLLNQISAMKLYKIRALLRVQKSAHLVQELGPFRLIFDLLRHNSEIYL